MQDYTTRTRTHSPSRSTMRRVEDYLRSRSPEHWAFFAAGFVAAALLT